MPPQGRASRAKSFGISLSRGLRGSCGRRPALGDPWHGACCVLHQAGAVASPTRRKVVTASLRQPRLPVLETWIEELLTQSNDNEREESHVALVEGEPRAASEPILTSCLRPHVLDAEALPETLRPVADSAAPAACEERLSDLRELSPLLEGDELDLLRFGDSA